MAHWHVAPLVADHGTTVVIRSVIRKKNIRTITPVTKLTGKKTLNFEIAYLHGKGMLGMEDNM